MLYINLKTGRWFYCGTGNNSLLSLTLNTIRLWLLMISCYRLQIKFHVLPVLFASERNSSLHWISFRFFICDININQYSMWLLLSWLWPVCMSLITRLCVTTANSGIYFLFFYVDKSFFKNNTFTELVERLKTVSLLWINNFKTFVRYKLIALFISVDKNWHRHTLCKNSDGWSKHLFA